MSLSNEDLYKVRLSVRKVLEKHLSPNVDYLEQKGEFSKEAFRALGEMGFVAPMLPEPYGINCLMTQMMVAIEMGRVCNGFGLSALASVDLFGANVSWWGSDEQKEKYLPGIASGEKIGCWGLTEPDVGSNAVAIKTRSHLEGDHYILHGTKTFITNAPIADYFIVITRECDSQSKKPITAPDGNLFYGGTAFILEKEMEGVTVGEPFKKCGHRSSPTGEIFLDNVRVPRSHVLGKPHYAFKDMKHSLDVERVIFFGLGLGLMEYCLETVIRYGSQRKQFGVPIIEHQMIQDKIAMMGSKLEVMRVFAYDTIKKMNNKEDFSKQAAIAKLLGSKMANEIASEAVQCLGGCGYIEEYGVERCFRDAKLFDVGGGTTEIQKLIVAKQFIKEVLSHD